MRPKHNIRVRTTLLALAMSMIFFTGAGPVAPAEASAQEGVCTATGATLDEAVAAYERTCEAPRVDCDPSASGWTCSSEIIGDAAPGQSASESVTPVPEGPCSAGGGSLDEAIAAYEGSCDAPRVDCDPSGPSWTCSSVDLPGTGSESTEPAQEPEPIDVAEPVQEPEPVEVAEPVQELESSVTVESNPPAEEAGERSTTAPEAAIAQPAQVEEEAPQQEAPQEEAEQQQEEPENGEQESEETPELGEPVALGEAVELRGAAVVEAVFADTDGPDRNPLKGWNSGWSDDRPETTVGFQYLKWKDFEPENGTFDFGAVEDVINRPGSKGRHIVLRLYCDWWGEAETSRGCPDWMYDQVGVDRIEGDNGRYITDYNDIGYVEQATQAINALGERYNDDPRMYSVQLGVLGYWGEWHTWGSQIDGAPYKITDATKQRIHDAYLSAFDRVAVVGRYPSDSVLESSIRIGFHNDYFRPDNDHSAEFDQRAEAQRSWQNGPIGGEIPPGLSGDDFAALYDTSQGLEMIQTGRYSTMKPASVDGRYLDAHLELHRQFGYQYQIERAQFLRAPSSNEAINAAVTVQNVGVAPFYYDWEVQFALLDANGDVVVASEAIGYDLRAVNPDEIVTLTGSLDVSATPSGQYRIATRILQPGADEPKASPWGLEARNTYVLFANDVPVIDGRWGDANELVGGWSVLGLTTVG